MMSGLLSGHEKEEWLKLTPCTEAMLSYPESSFPPFLSFFLSWTPLAPTHISHNVWEDPLYVEVNQNAFCSMWPKGFDWYGAIDIKETKILFLYRAWHWGKKKHLLQQNNIWVKVLSGLSQVTVAKPLLLCDNPHYGRVPSPSLWVGLSPKRQCRREAFWNGAGWF